MFDRLTVYPANRLEDLALLLRHVLDRSPGPVLAPGTVIVESKGMQHWVSMALAESRGLCVNVEFPLPGRFVWRLIREVLGRERVPTESPYQREALVWRIDRLLASSERIEDPRFAEVTRYWQGEEGVDPLKRFQLSYTQADLFEQYVLFRPDWIQAWERNQVPEGLSDDWQGALWQALVRENPDHPVRLQREAIEALPDHRDLLPPQVCLFAINTLPPSTLQFFDVLARCTQVHLFHLNPCVSYWGDLQSEKQLAAQRAEQARRWLALADRDPGESDTGALVGEVGNPLLANLGGQGKEFFAALQGLETCEISAFDPPPPDEEASGTIQPTVLQRVQRDILTLRDARPTNIAKKVVPQVDDSITVNVCHSALRELQALHDWLLHRFNEDPTLTLRDVLVMCPQVEHYAPYVGAVFDNGAFLAKREGEVDAVPHLPASIADRAPKDAEPLISSFLELLNLPDSRFQISKVLDLLRLPWLQTRFGFGGDELATLEWWLSEACVHWGLNGEHKARVIGAVEASEMFSWDWGLRRLLLGFARGDRADLVDGQWLLPHVEGADALMLGRLMQLLERLQRHARQLARTRTPGEWGVYLNELRGAFFTVSGDSDGGDAADVLDQAINQLVRWTDQIGFFESLSLEVVRFYLGRYFGLPDRSNRFMTGQITFCSLEPMRSAPFRITAILGLNDGEYPRQQVPLGFDLMANTPRRAGDRSRRGDDRYLFLETLNSTREKLYLSYQGADSKNNSTRQPSLILNEFMDYLSRGYGWNFDSDDPHSQLRRQPLHPFSLAAFKGKGASFDARWLALANPGETRCNRIELPPPELSTEAGLPTLPLESLVRFFDNPSRAFAEQRLGLFLGAEDTSIDDAEPFDADRLAAFQGRETLLDACLDDGFDAGQEVARRRLRVSGHLPDSLHAEVILDQWDAAAKALAVEVHKAGGREISRVAVALEVGGVRLTADLPLVKCEDGPFLLHWRPAKVKAKDKLRLWFYHLCAVATGVAVASKGLYLNEDGKKGPVVSSQSLGEQANATTLLERFVDTWKEGLCRPLLLNADLGFVLCEAGYKKTRAGYEIHPTAALERQKKWEAAWDDGPYAAPYGAGRDPYVRWFWPEGEELETCWPSLQAIYATATAALLGADLEEAGA